MSSSSLSSGVEGTLAPGTVTVPAIAAARFRRASSGSRSLSLAVPPAVSCREKRRDLGRAEERGVGRRGVSRGRWWRLYRKTEA
jgi:hypothetical protein